jgi:hypothetical protein
MPRIAPGMGENTNMSEGEERRYGDHPPNRYWEDGTERRGF